MPRYAWLLLTFMVLLITDEAQSLKNVKLEISPEVVEYDHQVVLRCHYDLEQPEEKLYSLKWYRGFNEFYRYSPGEQIKIFNLTGIHVDTNNSNRKQVTLQNVGFDLTGNYSCEVTTDAPNFTTASNSKTLTVVSVPKRKPAMASEKPRYERGELLRANCTFPSSRPPVNLTFTLNGVQVDEHVKVYTSSGVAGGAGGGGGTGMGGGSHNSNSIRDQDGEKGRQRAEINLELQPYHFVGGQLNLRCSAEIPGIYSSLSELQLGSVKEPVPARVTSSDKTATHHHKMADPLLLGLPLLTFYFR